MAGGVSSVSVKLADDDEKLPQPSPAIKVTGMAASHVSWMEGDGGDVVHMTPLQSSVATAPPCELIQLLKIVLILGWLQLPLASEAGVVMTGATALVIVKVFTTMLILLQLSFAVKVTSMTPQNEVTRGGGSALSVFDITPHPASVAVKLARCVASHVEYCAMAFAQGAVPFCRLFAMTGGVLSGRTVMVCTNTAVLPRSSSATHVRVIVPPVHGAALFVSVRVSVSTISWSSQLSLISISATGIFPVQLTVRFCGSDSGSKTGGIRSMKAMVKPKRAELPKLSIAW